MSVVGLDFGYQNSVIAAAGKGGVDVILNGNSNRLNPSMVGFDDCRRMGEMAVSGASSNYKNTIRGMKRLVGLAFDDCAEERKECPFETVPLPRTNSPPSVGVKITLAGEESVLPVELVAGMMIRHMGLIAAQKAAQASQDVAPETLFPQDWVVAIPNYYTDAQRRALQAGCEMVGVPVQRFMHENTATALAFGIFKDLKKVFVKDEPVHVMFIDMGATAMSVSIAAFEPGKLTVESAHCDATLGGRAFDLLIAEWIASEFEQKYKAKLSGKPMERPKTRLKLLAAAEKAKKTLSPAGVKETPLNLEMLMDDLDFHCSLKAKHYEEMITPLLDRLEAPIRACLQEAKLDVSQLSSVEIVGGSTRIGAVKRRLQEILGGMTLSTTMNADEAVARGAALQSAILSPRFKVLPYEIIEAQPYPIKVAWGEEEGSSVVMFERGVSFPVVKRVTLKRTGPFQVKALYTTDNREIAVFDVKMPNQAEEKKVRVNIKADISGILSLSSAQMVEETEEDEVGEDGKKKVKVTKTNLEASTMRPLDWSSQEIAKYHETEVAMANVDRIVRETADMQNELESYIYDMRDKIQAESHYGPYGTDQEKAAFTALSEQTETWLYEDGFDAKKSVYADKLAALKKLGKPMENRKYEGEHRPRAIQRLQNDINYFTTWVNESQTDEKYAHITDEDRNAVRQMTDQVSAWMYEKLDQQGNLAPSEDPVVTVAHLEQQCRLLHEKCGPIKAKPKPKPAPEPAPMETESTEQPMETD